jgi:hypothetical protein
MTGVYRNHEIRVTQEGTRGYFLVLYPNGAKFSSGYFSLTDSLRAKYQELKNRIDLEEEV